MYDAMVCITITRMLTEQYREYEDAYSVQPPIRRIERSSSRSSRMTVAITVAKIVVPSSIAIAVIRCNEEVKKSEKAGC